MIHADQHTIMVREADNEMKIHTFTYADKAKDKISKVLDAGRLSDRRPREDSVDAG